MSRGESQRQFGAMIEVRMRRDLWQDVLFDLLELKNLDDPCLGSVVLTAELTDAIVDAVMEDS